LSRSVFRDRLARIREALGEADLAALVVLTPENFLYVSGYFLDVQPWERPVAAVVPRDEDPFLIMHELSTNHVRYANEHESMRMVKCEEELALIREGAELSDWGQARYRDHLAPGRPLAEIDTLVAHEMAAEAVRRFPEYKVEIRVSGLTGPNSACPHGISGDYGQVVEAGHGIVNIVIPRLNGYVCENERTFFVGTP